MAGDEVLCVSLTASRIWLLVSVAGYVCMPFAINSNGRVGRHAGCSYISMAGYFVVVATHCLTFPQLSNPACACDNVLPCITSYAVIPATTLFHLSSVIQPYL